MKAKSIFLKKDLAYFKNLRRPKFHTLEPNDRTGYICRDKFNFEYSMITLLQEFNTIVEVEVIICNFHLLLIDTSS